jgi:catechol 2,3-dioxygenase-like lactoylglutathione lyase family enzyme
MSTQPALDFVVIRVADIEASFRYYTETLGFTTDPTQNGPDFRYLKGAPGGIDFGLFQADETHQPGSIELYLGTRDLEGLRQELLNKQVEVSPIMHPPFGDIFTVPSPDGESLTVWKPRA